MSETGAPPPPPADQTPPMPPPAPAPAQERNTVMIVLSYLWLLALVPLLVEKDDPEVQWHAKHGLVLTAAWIILYVALTVVGVVVGTVSATLGCLLSIVHLIVMLGIIVIHVLCIVKGINGEKYLVPGVSQYADKF